MGAEGAVRIIYKRDIAGSPTPEARRERFEDDYRERFANPYRRPIGATSTTSSCRTRRARRSSPRSRRCRPSACRRPRASTATSRCRCGAGRDDARARGAGGAALVRDPRPAEPVVRRGRHRAAAAHGPGAASTRSPTASHRRRCTTCSAAGTRPSVPARPGFGRCSALLGTATIPVVWALGPAPGGKRAGLVAAALLAFNPMFIWFSQEARTYALLALLGALGGASPAARPNARSRHQALRRTRRRACDGDPLLRRSSSSPRRRCRSLFACPPGAPPPAARPGAACVGSRPRPARVGAAGERRAAFIADRSLADPRSRRCPTSSCWATTRRWRPADLVLALPLLLSRRGRLRCSCSGARPGSPTRRGLAAVVAAHARAASHRGAAAGEVHLITRNLLAVAPIGARSRATASSPPTRRCRTSRAARSRPRAPLGLVDVGGVVADPARQRDDWRGAAELSRPRRSATAPDRRDAGRGARPAALLPPGLVRRSTRAAGDDDRSRFPGAGARAGPEQRAAPPRTAPAAGPGAGLRAGVRTPRPRRSPSLRLRSPRAAAGVARRRSTPASTARRRPSSIARR